MNVVHFQHPELAHLLPRCGRVGIQGSSISGELGNVTCKQCIALNHRTARKIEDRKMVSWPAWRRWDVGF